MTGSGACSSFSVATTVFVSLAICAVISYGVFYYFKQRLSLIEHSQMEQARIMQAIISRGLAAQQQSMQSMQSTQPTQPTQSTQSDQKSSQKEITITQSSLIEVSSDDDDDESQESQSDSSDESDSESESDESKWSIGDEIHQPDGYHEEFSESFKKNILIDAICIDSSYVVDSITIEQEEQKDQEEQKEQEQQEQQEQQDQSQQKKIISLNRIALNNHDDDSDHDDDDDDSSSSEDQDQDHVGKEHKDNDVQEFELKIGYKPSSSNKAMQLNYGNMSVSALRQLAKERGLGGEEGDLQKLKKKDLVQLLQ
jgi:hypothetical protein